MKQANIFPYVNQLKIAHTCVFAFQLNIIIIKRVQIYFLIYLAKREPTIESYAVKTVSLRIITKWNSTNNTT